MPDTTPGADLEAKRARINEKLEALRVAPEIGALVLEADQAVAAFKAEAVAFETQLAEIDSQIGARERGKRDAAAQQWQELRRAQRRELVETSEVRFSALEEAEAATLALIDALERVLSANARMAKLAQELGTGKVPSGLSERDLVARLSGQLAARMQGLKGHKFRFGSIEWVGASLHGSQVSWREQDERRIAADLRPLLEEQN
jgi:DNA repair exonuclease SbcCD ATPase subunit